MNSEKERLETVFMMYGIDETIRFAKQTLLTYRKAVLQSRKRGFSKPHHASLPEYRRGFIESYCYLKHFLKVNNV